jgi:hypothetical protein
MKPIKHLNDKWTPYLHDLSALAVGKNMWSNKKRIAPRIKLPIPNRAKLNPVKTNLHPLLRRANILSPPRPI